MHGMNIVEFRSSLFLAADGSRCLMFEVFIVFLAFCFVFVFARTSMFYHAIPMIPQPIKCIY